MLNLSAALMADASITPLMETVVQHARELLARPAIYIGTLRTANQKLIVPLLLAPRPAIYIVALRYIS